MDKTPGWTPYKKRRGGSSSAGPRPPDDPQDGSAKLVRDLGNMPGAEDLNKRLAVLLRNDVANAERLIHRRGEDLTHIKDVGWHAWLGTHWSRDDGEGEAQIAAQETGIAMFAEADAIEAMGPRGTETAEEFDKRVAAHRRWASGSGNSGRITAMLSEAQPHLQRTIDDMDSDPWKMSVANGTLILKPPIVLVPHDRAHMISRCSPVPYDAAARCPNFLQFLDRILPDPELRGFLKRWFGYCLTGSVAEQCLVLFHGVGANGKSTLLEAMQTVFGDYAMTLPFASLLHDDRRRGSEASPDLARLPGARLVQALEADVGARFSESLLKSLTGGDRLTVRKLQKDFFEFKPQFKLCLSFNNKPTVRGQDEGIWRRLLLVPFAVQIPPEERDHTLIDKLRAEASGILNYLLEGLELYHEIGLAIPAAVRAATDTYRQDSDPIGQFLADACTRTQTVSDTVSAKRLYGAYCGWCKANGQEPVSTTLFGRMLADRGIEKAKIGTVFYTRLTLTKDYGAASGADISGEPPPGEPGDPGPGPDDHM